MNHGQVAKIFREDKELHPERYCCVRGCLWKTAMVAPDGKGYALNVDPCRKHPELNTAPARTAVELGRSRCSVCGEAAHEPGQGNRSNCGEAEISHSDAMSTDHTRVVTSQDFTHGQVSTTDVTHIKRRNTGNE